MPCATTLAVSRPRAKRGARTRALVVTMTLLIAPLPSLAAGSVGRQPYDEKLLRLSELLGSLHYLRELCGAREGTLWRDRMNALINAEDPTPERRRAFIDRFNSGYSVLAEVHHGCTPTAVAIVERYSDEGARLIREIRAQYAQ